MKYLNKSFTMPTTNRKMTDLEYDLAVGKITQEQFDTATGKTKLDVQGVAVQPAPKARKGRRMPGRSAVLPY